ncbi:MAG: ATP-binding cassette domain-containing protein [Thalassobaculales bacterium]
MALVAEPLLSVSGLGRRYGAVEALAGVDLAVHAGEIVALCGDNGAGKSTFIRIISGAQGPSAGGFAFDGRPARFASPADALAAGIATIYQDLALAPRLSIAQNVFLGAELTRRFLGIPILDKQAMRRAAGEYLGQLAIRLPDLDAAVESLSGGQRQAVAIARALRWNARLVIMDEPTAALGVRETAQVLDLIRALKARGVAVLLVSHAMEDVIAVADRVAILKAGRKLGELKVAGLSAERLSHAVATGRLAEAA